MKHCKKCDTSKPLDEFHKKSSSKDGRTSNCKSCIMAYNKSRYNKREDKNRKLLKAYGITIDEYEAMLNRQGGKCAICEGGELASDSRDMAVDHCHATGKVRGILCSHCNRALGFFKDSERNLERAIKYLRGGE